MMDPDQAQRAVDFIAGEHMQLMDIKREWVKVFSFLPKLC